MVFIATGFGNELRDAGWNAWIGDMSNVNEVLGVLHALYGLGAALVPLVATSLVTKGWEWYTFYYFMVGASIIEILTLVTFFWRADGDAFREEHPQSQAQASSSPILQSSSIGTFQREGGTKGSFLTKLKPRSLSNSSNPTLEAVSSPITWLSALFLLIYLGVEVSIGGWTVTFMLRIRHASPYLSGATATVFWVGVTLGRVILGFVTGRVFPSEKSAVATYLGCAIVCHLLFWLVPSTILSVVLVAGLGVALGPMFPAAIVAMTKLLPKRLHVAGVGFAAAVGGHGGDCGELGCPLNSRTNLLHHLPLTDSEMANGFRTARDNASGIPTLSAGFYVDSPTMQSSPGWATA